MLHCQNSWQGSRPHRCCCSLSEIEVDERLRRPGPKATRAPRCDIRSGLSSGGRSSKPQRAIASPLNRCQRHIPTSNGTQAGTNALRPRPSRPARTPPAARRQGQICEAPSQPGGREGMCPGFDAGGRPLPAQPIRRAGRSKRGRRRGAGQQHAVVETTGHSSFRPCTGRTVSCQIRLK